MDFVGALALLLRLLLQELEEDVVLVGKGLAVLPGLLNYVADAVLSLTWPEPVLVASIKEALVPLGMLICIM